MNNKKLLIAGLDPGITTAAAFLDIGGNLIYVKSSKQFDLNSIIAETLDIGKVILVGTDKHKIPNLVESYATKLGARAVSPEEDLGVEEKRAMTRGLSFKDEHQADALASALFAYKSVKPLLDRIDNFAEKNRKHEIKNKIKDIVVTKRISIRSAASLIEKNQEEDKAIERVIAERKFREEDFLKLYDRLKRRENEVRLLRNYSSSLRNRLASLQAKKSKEKNNARIYDFRENRARSLEGIVRVKSHEIEKLKSVIRKLNSVLSGISDFYVLKKLGSLGALEFKSKSKILNIKKNDVLLVDDPNIASSEVVDLLRDNVFIIAHKRPVSRKIESELPFIFVDARNLRIDEDKYFGFVDKNQFESEKNKMGWARKMIENYKREKELSR